MTHDPIKKDYVPREVISEQLLAALDTKLKVAILASEADLNLLIDALDTLPGGRLVGAVNPERDRMLQDLRTLRQSAFGEN